MLKKLILIVGLIIVSTFAQSYSKINKIDTLLTKENLKYLASDELKGREAGTESEKVASDFIAKELKKYNVKSFGDDNTYFQNFNLTFGKLEANSSISLSNISEKMKLNEDFVIVNSSKDPSYSKKENEIIFVGYGISAEEYEYDDYKDIDCKGKTIVFVSGCPSEFKELEAKELAKYVNIQRKIVNAVKKQPSGIIVLSDSQDDISRYWNMLVRMSESENVISENANDLTGLILAMKLDGAKKLFENEIINFEKIKEKISKGESLETFNFSKKILYEINYTIREKKVRNVLGILEGQDPKLKDEYIVLSAHYDHVGTNDTLIYNGADDNASGTVAVMEIARKLQNSDLKRSIIFSLFTAEEKGLIGSMYFTNKHSSMENVIANINFDMVARGSTDSITCIASSRLDQNFSKFIQAVNDKTEKMVLNYKLEDDKSMHFGSSDHFGFNKKNKPVVFFYDEDKKYYHKTIDDYETLNFKKLFRIISLGARITYELANITDSNEIR